MSKEPSGQNIADAIALCTTTVEGAAYLSSELNKKTGNTPEYEPFRKNAEAARDFAEFRQEQQNRVNPFAGDPQAEEEREKINFQDFVGVKGLSNLNAEQQLPEEIDFIYHIDENSVYTRAYIANGVQLDAVQSEVLDSGFNSWLDDHNMVSKQDTETNNVTIYNKNKSSTDKLEKVSPPVFSNAIEASENGPQVNMSRLNRNLNVKVVSNEDYTRMSQGPEQNPG